MGNFSLLGRFTVGTSNDSMGIGSNTFAINAGSYYVAGWDGESTEQFIEKLQGHIRAEVDNQASANISYTVANSTVTIDLTTAANITFDDSEIAHILGFNSASQASASTHTSDKTCRYTWAPSKNPSGYPISADQFWNPRSSSKSGRSMDGVTYTVQGNITYDGYLEFVNLTEDEVIIPSGGTNYYHLQQFFEDVVHVGEPFRVITGNSYKASDEYVTAIWGAEDAEEIGGFTDYAERHIQSYNGLWDITIPLMKYVT